MSCYYPLTGYRSKSLNESGKRPIVFDKRKALDDNEITLPCGRCIGCRLTYSRNWAIRCVHEAQMHEENSFITLTYNDDHLPYDRSVHVETLQKFLKRLRKSLEPKKIRFFACGEYGTLCKKCGKPEKGHTLKHTFEKMLGRPHYHLILFGHTFNDKIPWKKINGNLIYRSAQLEKLWGYGYSSLGDVTFESAAYVARYTMKKQRPDKRQPEKTKEHYQVINHQTGEIHQVNPEFCTMSRRPGIGKTWLEKYKTDTDKDFITVQGRKMPLPKYYDQLLYEMGEDIDLRKEDRKALINHKEQTYYRLKHRQQVKEAQIKQLIREL